MGSLWRCFLLLTLFTLATSSATAQPTPDSPAMTALQPTAPTRKAADDDMPVLLRSPGTVLMYGLYAVGGALLAVVAAGTAFVVIGRRRGSRVSEGLVHDAHRRAALGLPPDAGSRWSAAPLP